MTSALRVLMVEDNEDDALLILEALAGGGYDAHAQRVDGEDGLRRALRDGPWDIVLSDYSLPSFSGLGALRVLRETGFDGPAIVVSGTVGEDVAVETLKFGADDYLLKQNLTRLVPAVRQALGAAESRRRQRRLEHLHTLILENSLDLICTLDMLGRVVEVSAAAKAVLGCEPAALAGMPLEKLVHPDDLERVRDEFKAIVRGRRTRDFECRLLHKSGRPVDLTWSAVLSKDDRVIVCVGRDMTERKQRDAVLREERDFSDTVLNGLPGIFYHFDYDGRFLRWNRNFERISGYAPEELAAMRALDFIAAEERPMVASRIEEIDDRGNAQIEAGLVVKDGRRIPYLFTGWRFGQNGRKGFVGVGLDVTEQKRAEQRLRYLATHDDLTGLPNRSLIQDRIWQAIAHARRSGRRFALLYLDLDRFKVINDGYGHPFGDEVLKVVGERLAGSMRDGDTVARQGGDEFLILLADLASDADAQAIAQKIIDGLARPVVVHEREVHLSGSVGVSVFPQDGETAEALIGSANVAMYRAKDLGRNTCQSFTRQMSEETQRRVDLETRLRSAAAAGQMQLAYQPKASLADGRITGCEVLLRWEHPELGMVPPGRFIPIAEDSGLIVPIGDWVLHTACAQAKAWLDAGLPPVRIAVNLSTRQFLQQDVVAWVMRVLRETGLPPAQLELELTESLIAQEVEKVIATIVQLKALGVKLAIDDFGTGYSSLNYLKRFRVDTLKIDQSFVRNMLAEAEDAAIVQAIVSLAHSLGLEVIAEGVETEPQCRFLREHRCDEIQGYYFSRPVAAAQFEAMLRQDRRLG